MTENQNRKRKKQNSYYEKKSKMATISAEHPFQIELVVNHIFQYLRLQDIIKQRAVCKLWHEIGTKLLVDRIDEIQITFGSNCSWDVPDPRKTVENFLQMQANCSFKFTNFSTYYFDSDLNGKIPKAEQTTHLFNQYGIHMKKVRLELSGKNCWRFLSDVLMTKAPNVEALVLHGYPNERIIEKKLFPQKKPELKLKSIILVSCDEYDDPIFNYELLTDLIQSSPHLECIAVDLDAEQISFDRIWHEHLILATLVSTGNISNLKHLSFANIHEDEFEILATSFKRAPLTVFEADITQIESTETLCNIKTFLEDHKDTWTTLNLSFPCVDPLFEMNFPTMTNLKHLSITEMYEEELDKGRAPFGIFDFGRQFPNLVTLYLREDPKTESRRFFNLKEWFPEEAMPVLSLKKLTLPPQFDAKILRRIGHIFPNVISLKLTVQTVDVLKELWVTWPGIKKLEIIIIPAISFGSTSLDSIFTGIPDASLKTLLNRQANPVALKSFPFIGGLKDLNRLIIKGPDLSESYKKNQSFNTGLKITDETVRLALRNLKQLAFLHISSDCHEISQSGVQDLCIALGLEKTDDIALRLVKYEWQKKIRIFNF